MNIVPKLNLNKHPHAIDNNSIVYAENMMVSKDNTILQNENVCDYNNDILNGLSDKYTNGVNIIYALPCNTEIIFFIRPNDTDTVLDVLRYNEITKEAKIVLDNFEYNGGTLLGGFTYSKNNLIVTISEYFDSPNSEGYKAVPLRVINLGSDISQSEYINNSDIHSLVPKVIIPTIENEYINGRAYKGWYYIFIRYKIDEHDYTQWYNTNKCLFVDEFEDTKILSYYIDKNLKVGEHTVGENNYETENSLVISKNDDIVNISFINNIVNNFDNKYDNYQLGFICVSKTYTKAFKTSDLDKTTSTVIFSNENVDEYSATELIKSYYNYYNVKSLDIVNNRIYIGNYNNNDTQNDLILPNVVDITNDDGSITQGPLLTIKPIQNEVEQTDVELYKTAKVKLSYENTGTTGIEFKGELFEDLKQITINGKKVWCLDATHFYIGNQTYIGNPNDFIVLPETEMKISYKRLVDDVEVTYRLTVQAKRLVYVYDDKLKGYYVINNDIIKLEPQYNYLFINKYGDVDVPDDTLIFWMHFFDYDIEEISHKSNLTSSINILKSNGILPNSYYNFYIHFVDEYGISTNGIPIGKFDSDNLDINNFLTIEGKYNGIDLFGYKGFFISYEKFEPIVLIKGIAKVDAERNKLLVYSDQLNFNDSINLAFDKVKLFNVTTEIDKLNKNLNSDKTYSQIYNVRSKKLRPADSPNNILASTNLELEIDIESVSNLIDNEYIVYLYREDDSLLYTSENKILIPCSDVIYDITKPFIINTRNSFNSTVFALIYESKTFFDDATKVYKYLTNSITNLWINKEPFYIYKFKDFLEVPNESIVFNNAPLNIFYLAGINDDNTNNSLYPGRVVDVRNTIDLFKQPQVRVYDLYPKILNWRNPNVKYENEFNKTIRRSHVMQDESNNNAWRWFDTEEYRNINENKGNIVKLVGIGKYFIVHTEHSMFLFNATDTIKSDEGGIQLASTDIMNLSYQEVITSKLGYGGIQKETHGIVGSFGYVWYDESDKRFYNYDNKSISTIDDDVRNYIKFINIENLVFGDDKERNRLFIKLNDLVILSYNYALKRFISFHNDNTFKPQSVANWPVTDIKFFSTKNKLYIGSGIVKRLGGSLPEERPTYITNYNITNFVEDTYSKSSISIINNHNYELMKYIDNIIYKVNKVKAVTDYTEYPVEGKHTLYAADYITVYSELCNTGRLKIDTTNNLNSPDNYMTPYWRFGNWHFNALRNRLKDEISADEKSRIFGNWFVVKFEFDTNEKIEIESLECKTSIAEY